ncbi:mRNA splicing protein [Vermiconidia calcicola]|uniref:mRNA splicing protein n=1 Tax=Vermiconidia calcicola TaxID=1690605 RepID=A0ACC3NQD6_9PEZI|nr:mRNA splicing protein [Vermiconidia calcicola]
MERTAADGRGLQDVTITEKVAQFAEALKTANRHAREEVQQRQKMQQRLAEQREAANEEHLYRLAMRARAEQRARTEQQGQSLGKAAQATHMSTKKPESLISTYY